MITYIVYAFLIYLLVGVIYIGRFIYKEFSFKDIFKKKNKNDKPIGLVFGGTILILGLILFVAWGPIVIKYKL